MGSIQVQRHYIFLFKIKCQSAVYTWPSETRGKTKVILYFVFTNVKETAFINIRATARSEILGARTWVNISPYFLDARQGTGFQMHIR